MRGRSVASLSVCLSVLASLVFVSLSVRLSVALLRHVFLLACLFAWAPGCVDLSVSLLTRLLYAYMYTYEKVVCRTDRTIAFFMPKQNKLSPVFAK